MAIREHPMGYRDFRRHWISTAWNKSWNLFSLTRGWREAVRATVFVALVVLASIGGAVALKSKEISVSVLWWLTVIPSGVLIISFIWNLPKAPHEIYLGLEQKRQKDIADKQAEVDAMARNFTDAKAQIETEESKSKKQKLDGDRLGLLSSALDHRKEEILGMKYWGYNERYPNLANNEIDPDTLGVLNRIIEFLIAAYTASEVAVFKSYIDMPVTQRNPHYDLLSQNWWSALCRLEHYERQLNKIIAMKVRH